MTNTSIKRPSPNSPLIVMVECPYCGHDEPYRPKLGYEAADTSIGICRNDPYKCGRPFVVSAQLIRCSGTSEETIMIQALKIEGYDEPMFIFIDETKKAKP